MDHAGSGSGHDNHVPVLAEEALDALHVQPDGVYVDGTFGGGGHAALILEKLGPDGLLIAFDRDVAVEPRAKELAAEYRARLEFVHASYATVEDALDDSGIAGVDGILLDLGLSSLQLADSERGFSFTQPGPLDMRFDTTRGSPASYLVNTLEQGDLADLIYQYGEERRSRPIARAIVRERERAPIETTERLAAIVERALGGRRGSRTHPATRTFQALRIATNDELGELERGLRAGLAALLPGGRFVVIAFHSLEDRIVKRFFADEARGCDCPPEALICTCGREPTIRLVGKAIKPSASEVQRNPRARSAIMRVVERLP